jgi:sugar transferase (PEP-CTERM/EpsH1 system associated)
MGKDANESDSKTGKRILLLTPQLPYPPHQGTTIRNYNLLVNLAARHEVHLLSFVHSHDELPKASPLQSCCRSVESVLIPQRSNWHRLWSVFFSPLPDMALRLPSKVFQSKLTTTLGRQRFDVVQVEGIEMAQYGLWLLEESRGARPLIVFDDHNAEYVLQQRAFETDARRPGRWPAALYSFIQWRKLSRYESEICRRANRVVAVSETDEKALRHLIPGLKAIVIPNGVDTEYYKPQSLPCYSQTLVFTGKMDFRPNIDAVLWFCREVLPLLRAAIPTIHFYIVGQKPHRRILPLADSPAVTITGYVDDIRPYIARAALYVIPLRIGGGTRLKVMEAMAMGKAIVSTTVGCEGFKVTAGRELVMADSAADFARRVIELLGDDRARESLGREARRFVERHYDWRSIVPRLDRVYDDGV